MFRMDTEKPGLYLVQAEPHYAEELFDLVDQNRAYLRRWLPWLDYNQSPEDSRSFLRNCQANYAAQTQINTLIFWKDTLVGTTGFNSINHTNHVGEIGYWLSEHWMGRGFMTAATRKVIEFGFKHLNLNRQVIRAMTDNQPSRAVADRLGFTFEGIEREGACQYGHFVDMAVYSLLKAEWQAGEN